MVKFETDIGTQKGNEKALKANKRSVFSLTVNPNVSSEIGTQFHYDLHDRLLNKTQELFGSEEAFAKLIKFKNPEHSFCDEYIKSIELVPTVEYGALKKWHLQAYINIEHQSNIQLDRTKLINEYAKAANVKPENVHINIAVEGANNSKAYGIRNYVLKNRNNAH